MLCRTCGGTLIGGKCSNQLCSGQPRPSPPASTDTTNTEAKPVATKPPSEAVPLEKVVTSDLVSCVGLLGATFIWLVVLSYHVDLFLVRYLEQTLEQLELTPNPRVSTAFADTLPAVLFGAWWYSVGVVPLLLLRISYLYVVRSRTVSVVGRVTDARVTALGLSTRVSYDYGSRPYSFVTSVQRLRAWAFQPGAEIEVALDPKHPNRAYVAQQGPRGILWMLFSFEGRVPRRIYWGVGVLGSSTSVALQLFLATMVWADALIVVRIALSFMFFWMAFAVTVKRWHDRNKSGAWILILLIPIVGQLWAFIEAGCMRGTRGRNAYGPDLT